jgi:CubicO group peptidase (beta-lactamase class C family)
MSTRAGGISRRGFLRSSGAALASAALPSRAFAAIDEDLIFQLVASFSAAHDSAALSVAIGRLGRIDYVRVFGEARPGVPLTPDHRFRIASLSKPITATAIMQLVEHRKLKLESRVFGKTGILGARYPTRDVPHRDWVEAITVDHLLTHTCGGWTNDANDPIYVATSYTRDEEIQMALRDAPLINPPGKKYAYSNLGFALLGRVIETIADTPYDVFARANVLEPAGAGGMHIGESKADEIGPDEVTYLGGAAPYGMNIPRMDSHGGWVGSPTELVRFGMAVDGIPESPDVLSPASIARMSKPTKAYSGYGRGWGVDQHGNRTHTGSLAGTSTLLAVMISGTCLAAFTNTRDSRTDNDLDTVAWAIADEVYG